MSVKKNIKNNPLPAEVSSLPLSGAYALILRVGETLRVRTGIHGRFSLPPGRYLYAGRASQTRAPGVPAQQAMFSAA